MKKFRVFGKVISIILGVVGVSTILASCKKDRTCTCTNTVTYTYLSGASYSYNTTSIQTAKLKDCNELNTSNTVGYGNGSSYTVSKTCVE